MKNTLSLIAALFIIYFVAQPAKAQMYEKGSIKLNAGIAFGTYGYYGYSSYTGGYSGFLPLTANIEYSINDKFAIGPYLGYFSRAYNNGSGYKDRWTSLSFGARGTLHASGLINELLDANINEEKLDLYASLLLGLETYSWKFDDRNTGGVRYYNNSSRIVLGPVIGARYMFVPNVGAYLELGRGAFGLATLGVTFKLK